MFPNGRRVRDFLGLDQIAPAQLGGIDPGGIGGRIDDALNQIARLRPSGTAIGARRQRVCEYAARVHLCQGNVIDSRQAAGDVGREHKMRDSGEICAEIADAVDAQRLKTAAGIERKLYRPE